MEKDKTADSLPDDSSRGRDSDPGIPRRWSRLSPILLLISVLTYLFWPHILASRLSPFSSFGYGSEAGHKQPNIIFILTDDQVSIAFGEAKHCRARLICDCGRMYGLDRSIT